MKQVAKVKRGDSFSDLFLTLSFFDGLSLAILQSKGNLKHFTERLHSFDFGEAKTTALSFKNLPEKLSVPAASFSGLVFLSNFKTESKLHLLGARRSLLIKFRTKLA